MQCHDVACLAARLHREALFLVTSAVGRHVEGLHQGVALLRGTGLSARAVRRLREVEVISGFTRHVTQYSVENVLAEIRADLKEAAKVYEERGGQAKPAGGSAGADVQSPPRRLRARPSDASTAASEGGFVEQTQGPPTAEGQPVGLQAAWREALRRTASEPEKEPGKKCGEDPAMKDLSESREDGIIVERQVEYDDLVQHALMFEDEKEKLRAKFLSLQSSEGSAVDDGSSDCVYQLTEQSDDDHKKEYRGKQSDLVDDERIVEQHGSSNCMYQETERSDDDHKREYRGKQFDLADDKRKALEQSLLATEMAISVAKGGVATIQEEMNALGAGILALSESVAEATEQRKQDIIGLSERIVERRVEYDNFVGYAVKLEEEKARLEAGLLSRQSPAESKLHGDPAIESSSTGCTAIAPLRTVRRAARRPRR